MCATCFSVSCSFAISNFPMNFIFCFLVYIRWRNFILGALENQIKHFVCVSYAQDTNNNNRKKNKLNGWLKMFQQFVNKHEILSEKEWDRVKVLHFFLQFNVFVRLSVSFYKIVCIWFADEKSQQSDFHIATECSSFSHLHCLHSPCCRFHVSLCKWGDWLNDAYLFVSLN